MNILRRITVGILGLILSGALFGAAWSYVSISTVHNRQAVKGWLVQSKFYDRIVDVVLEKASESTKKSGDTIPVDDPEIQKLASQTFSPSFLQSNIEKVLDSTYDWMDGSRQDIAFTVDFTSARQQLATGLGTYAANRSAKLPLCQAGQGSEDSDAFRATCRPAALATDQIGSQFTAQFLQQDFLKNPVFTADNIKIKKADGTTAPITQNAAAMQARRVYQKSSVVPHSLVLLSLFITVGIIFISSTRLKGLRRVGYVFASTGVFLLITYLALGPGVQALSGRLVTNGATSSKSTSLAIDFAKVIAQNIRQSLLWYIVAYLILGIGCYVLAHFLHKKQQAHEDGDTKDIVANEKLHTAEPALSSDAIRADTVASDKKSLDKTDQL